MRFDCLCACVMLCVGGPAIAAGERPAKSPKPSTRTAPATANINAKPRVTIGSVPDTGQFLPDDAIIVRVGDRSTRVFDFRDAYFVSEGESRPGTDSTGRIQFLKTIIDKDVMGLTARAINRPLSFEDRITMREYTSITLQNVLYARFVHDSVTVSDQEIDDDYQHFKYDQHLRDILFDDREVAERVRRDLLAGRITWKDAVQKHSLDPKKKPDGDLGWVKRLTVNGAFAIKVFSLTPGTFSEVIQDAEGYHIFQVTERRSISPPAKIGVQRLIAMDLRSFKAAPRVELLMRTLRGSANVTYDSTNIRWAAARFREAEPKLIRSRTDLVGKIPEFSPADTGRVLAIMGDRRITLGRMVWEYDQISPNLRRRLISLEPIIFSLDQILLEPEMLGFAKARGIEKDSLAIALIDKRREQMLVEHLYQDSVMSRVSITKEMRRKYFEDHKPEFATIPKVRYARFLRDDQAAADALISRLQGGESPESVLHADSLQGTVSGGILEEPRDSFNPIHRILFDELKPGKATRVGPDPSGHHAVYYLISMEPSREMKYEEVEGIIDESVQNIEAERLLREFLDRHARNYKIEAHPELVMRIRLIDPSLD